MQITVKSRMIVPAAEQEYIETRSQEYLFHDGLVRMEHRGIQSQSDTTDFTECRVSRDNGRTWGEWERKLPVTKIRLDNGDEYQTDGYPNSRNVWNPVHRHYISLTLHRLYIGGYAAATERYWRELFARIRPAPGAADVLRACRARGLRVGIGTDMSAIEQFRKLETLGLLDLVDFVATSEEAGVEKPHPAFFDLVVEKAGCAPGEILFVGDNLRKDVLGSAAAGLRGVWLQPDASARDARPETPSVATLSDLAALLPRSR